MFQIYIHMLSIRRIYNTIYMYIYVHMNYIAIAMNSLSLDDFVNSKPCGGCAFLVLTKASSSPQGFEFLITQKCRAKGINSKYMCICIYIYIHICCIYIYTYMTKIRDIHICYMKYIYIEREREMLIFIYT